MSVLWLQVLLMLEDINKEGLTVVVKSDLPILLLFSFIQSQEKFEDSGFAKCTTVFVP